MKQNYLILTMSVLFVLLECTGQARTVKPSRSVPENAVDDLFEYHLIRQLNAAPKRDVPAPAVDHSPAKSPWTLSRVGNSPADICAAVRQQVRYTRDAGPEDQWKPAWKTWSSGRGDCEDMAVVVQDICGERGIAVDVCRLYPADGKLGHVITLGHWKGQLWMSSNGSYQIVESVSAAVAHTAHALGWNPAEVEVVVDARSTATHSDRRGERDVAAPTP